MPVAKEQIRQIIADNNLSRVADVYHLLRDSFKDILQELMEGNSMPPSVMKRISKAIPFLPTKGTAIPPKP